MTSAISPFSLHFSASAWAQVGSVPTEAFETLHDVLGHFAKSAAARLSQGEAPSLDPAIPIAAGSLVAECTFDDFQKRITVTELVRWAA